MIFSKKAAVRQTIRENKKSIVRFASIIVIFFILKPTTALPYPASEPFYNSTYPLTPSTLSNGARNFQIGLIADMDKASKHPQKPYTWRSFFKKGSLHYDPLTNSVSVTFDDADVTEIAAGYSLKGRGMELSELVTFNGHILTVDDRTGIVYRLENDRVIPWVILMDGDGNKSKGFKCEWAAVKDKVLFVGSIGKEWTAGENVNHDPMYVKAITTTGEVHHLNWVDNYKKLRSALGIEYPGYLWHESGVWSPIHKKWFFLPRRCSRESYNEDKDELRGCDVLLIADEDFRSVETVKLGPYKSSYGFSSFKFLPGSKDNIIVALMTEEVKGMTATHITAFTITGQVLMKIQTITTDLKYEGFEFL